MSIIGFIVVGDRTSHGGVVISGDPSFTVDGKPIARKDDKVFCPRCKRTAVIVSSRFSSMFDMGKSLAFDQDVTDCGAVLYSRHNDLAGWDEDDGNEIEEGQEYTEDSNHNQEREECKPKIHPPRFQEHFTLHNNETGELLAGVPYTIKTGDGKAYEGETDEQGRTAVVWTDSPESIEVVAHLKLPDSADEYHYAEQDYSGL